MKLIVGLGNPGQEYDGTRHNVGFMVLDLYAKKHGLSFDKKKYQGEYLEFMNRGEKVLLLKPQSYMNLSGEVVEKFVHYFKISIADIFIIHDDLDLPVGSFKLKPKGSSGGHNGLKNIELHLKTQEYQRLKIGISNNKRIDTKDYVLGKFTKEEETELRPILEEAVSIIDSFLEVPFDILMNRYNQKK